MALPKEDTEHVDRDKTLEEDGESSRKRDYQWRHGGFVRSHLARFDRPLKINPVMSLGTLPGRIS